MEVDKSNRCISVGTKVGSEFKTGTKYHCEGEVSQSIFGYLCQRYAEKSRFHRESLFQIENL